MTIKEAQELVEALVEKKEIRISELSGAALLAEEIGKLSRVIANRYGGGVVTSKIREEVSQGVGDVFWSLLEIANLTGVDLTVALTQALERRSKKK